MIIKQEKNIEWKKEWNVGIPELDEQHKKLVEIINSLNTFEARQNPQVFAVILSELTDFVKEHHQTEESIMREYDYPELNKHMKEHCSLVLLISRFNLRYCRRVPTEAHTVLEIVQAWFINHELAEDKVWRDFVARADG